ncbi:hypothetical protein JIN85_16540 [Luteolibacter pohnpeiensis]|uniref:Uncharacterized protein n=1 Tax=Luteolibacter pohnpeiensis TaxID=454153 RepID=A0A934VY01_9BACT|nr:hypothetical protein [Luteolibacter pohnpeiensis]MBK1884029.1 hypothetical protein [Luteolibacter pohnpeiensis]
MDELDVLKNMKVNLLIGAFCFAAVATIPAEEIVIPPSADWQQPILSSVKFSAETKSADELLGTHIKQPSGRWVGFVVFTCEATKNLGKRLMWIDADVTFSNGYVREFTGVSFNILTEGTEIDIHKIPFEAPAPVTISKVVIKNAVIK